MEFRQSCTGKFTQVIKMALVFHCQDQVFTDQILDDLIIRLVFTQQLQHGILPQRMDAKDIQNIISCIPCMSDRGPFKTRNQFRSKSGIGIKTVGFNQLFLRRGRNPFNCRWPDWDREIGDRGIDSRDQLNGISLN